MEGFLKIEVEVIKYDGTNKDDIIDKLKITTYKEFYFRNINSYFIIPKHNKDDWFILGENGFKQNVIPK